ncbi:uncharacterized protein LOC103946796 [Pyrus x bretschneideri]|uniref:uncharacterized protein LOC103946796 n=1 Tax=Pyrus x bretschneideri TaxID=225117 RepID=UPI000511800C|nr:uncharacterized protein LOC103946796 [Pyrus x bretschneideri]
MLKQVFGKVWNKGVFVYGGNRAMPCLYVPTSDIHNGQVHCAPRSFFGVEDFLDDDNSRPYTYQKEKKSKNPTKHISFKQRTIAYMEPFTLDVFISKRFVSASITHRVTTKQVANLQLPVPTVFVFEELFSITVFVGIFSCLMIFVGFSFENGIMTMKKK